METHAGVVILITNLRDRIDPAFLRRLKFAVHFPVPPADLRQRLWRLLLPPETPISGPLDLAELARAHAMSGGNIKTAVFRAATAAALRGGAAGPRAVTQEDLRMAAEEETHKQNGGGPGGPRPRRPPAPSDTWPLKDIWVESAGTLPPGGTTRIAGPL